MFNARSSAKQTSCGFSHKLAEQTAPMTQELQASNSKLKLENGHSIISMFNLCTVEFRLRTVVAMHTKALVTTPKSSQLDGLKHRRPKQTEVCSKKAMLKSTLYSDISKEHQKNSELYVKC